MANYSAEGAVVKAINVMTKVGGANPRNRSLIVQLHPRIPRA
jgi:hypothetical protein